MAGARGRSAIRRLVAGACLVTLAALPAAALALRVHDPGALWRIVHDRCVPNELQHGRPAPCTAVDLRDGVARGYVLLKDLRGKTQYLLIPTARVTGIEDPQLLLPSAPNYFADAWRERSYTERAAGRALPRDALSLAVNSRYARSQNQLHIHIDCIRPEVRALLRRQMAAIGGRWARLPRRLAGRRYWAMRIVGAELGDADPFKLLAAGRPGARAAMGTHTLVVAGARFTDGPPGFILLDDRADLARGNRAGGERLQDHSCALARG
jgi:CDP-diacylglycerol pyrophosphatase